MLEITIAVTITIAIAAVLRDVEKDKIVRERDRAKGSETKWREYALQLKRKLGKKPAKQRGNEDWSDDSLHTRVMADQMPTLVFDPASKSGVRFIGDEVRFSKREDQDREGSGSG